MRKMSNNRFNANGAVGFRDNCKEQSFRVSCENSPHGSIAVDVVMPPSYQPKRDKAHHKPIQHKNEKGKRYMHNCSNIFEQMQKTVQDTRNKNTSNNDDTVLKLLSEQISFDSDVLEERSPHTIPFSKCDPHKIYDKRDIRSTKVKKRNDQFRIPKKPVVQSISQIDSLQIDNSTHKYQHQVTVDDDVLTVESSSDIFISGSNFSTEWRKSFEPEPSNQIVNTKKDCEKVHAHSWEYFVISKLSKATVDMIFKDMKPPMLAKYKKLFCLNDSEVIHKSESTNSLTEESIHSNESNKDKVKFDPSLTTYFEDVSHSNDIISHKNIQVSYPPSPNNWLENELVDENRGKVGIVAKGIQKWTNYPTLKTEEELVLQQLSNTSISKPVNVPIVNTEQNDTYALISVINEWRSAWVLDRKYEPKSLTELNSGMKDINEHNRFIAVSAVASHILDHQGTILGEELDSILNQLTKLLDGESSMVSLAAALTLFCMNRASAKSKAVLIQTVQEGYSSERWVAIQCLTHYLYHDNCIIKELISNMTGKDEEKQIKSMELLRNLSLFSLSVQYLVAEKLNSSNWKDRSAACQVLPTLHGTLSSDISGKLSQILWNDWSHHVRQAALEALGNTGNGKIVHTTLIEHLQSNDPDSQVSALKMISSIGIMTVRLLSPLLLCLQSGNDNVCLQSIKLCKKMKLYDEAILNILAHLLNSERATKIRIYLLKAMGVLGENSKLIRDNLLWTLHFDKQPEMRKEACSTIIKLKLCDKEIIDVLQEIVFIDNDSSVRQEVVFALCSMGSEAIGNLVFMKTIKDSIKQLCAKDNVVAYVVDGKLGNLDLSSDRADADKEADCCEHSSNDMDSSHVPEGVVS